MINLFKKKVLILGGGKTGLSTAIFCKNKHAEVSIYDENNDKSFVKFKNMNIKTGKINFNKLNPKNYDYIIQSPGVDRKHKFLQKADFKKVPVLGEIEFISQFCKVPIIAVTGTNGKTTTVNLLKHFLNICKRKIKLAGNVGIPFSGVLDDSLDYIILETSSYQLETIKTFKPHISIITNLSPDHLERHETMEKYINIKKQIFLNMNKKDFLIINNDNYFLRKIIKEKYCFKTFKISTNKKIKGIYFKNNSIYLNISEGESIYLFDISIINLIGKHNLENIMLAYLGAFLAGCDLYCLKKGVETFKGIEHRLEFVSNINGVKYYNDSKATNPEATIVALKSFKNKKVYLILGGSYKNLSYKSLSVEINLNNVIPIIQGETAKFIKKNLCNENIKNIMETKNLKEAVLMASKNAKNGDIVLLSPACPSFDQFDNFEVRGKKFKEYIYEIEKKNK